MLTLTSPSETSACTITPEFGGRIESLSMHRAGQSMSGRRELLLPRHADHTAYDDIFFGGCFVMAPYCGRVRDGHFAFAGHTYDLPRRQGPHALHGTVIENHWVVLQCTESRAVLACELGPEWPFEGTLHHAITLDDDALVMTLTLTANDAMPAQIGWHPWFFPPHAYTLPFASLLKRDEHGITTSTSTPFDPSLRGTFDDCFIERHEPIVLGYPDLDLILDSDCSHWVVFDRRADGVCFEPQSGPPNAANEQPQVLRANEQMSRWFEIRWREHSTI